MREINRYHVGDDEETGSQSSHGDWCKWSDVQALQRELQETTAKALAAIWLIPAENLNAQELKGLQEEARKFFTGKDQKTIIELQESLRKLQAEAKDFYVGKEAQLKLTVQLQRTREELRYAEDRIKHILGNQQQRCPAVAVIGRKQVGKTPDVDFPLPVFRVSYELNGAINIGVYLP